MMNKIKWLLLHNKSGTANKTTTQEENNNKKKKKRFSLLLKKTSMIDPNDELNQHQQEEIKKCKISKSTSFLQLTSSTTTTAPTLKKSRSMFGQFYSTNNDAAVVDSTLLDYYAAAVSTENILHTSAVSISSFVNNSRNNSSDNNLQSGIQFYEKGQLEQASYYWKLSAEENDSSPLGIFFYGLALRHGWGCRKSPALAQRYLQKVATEYSSVYDLQADLTQFVSAAKIELLVLTIYELGEFFWHGWEVPKSVTIASYYFKVASNMGNTDAMNDLAFCYKHGHGLEKNDFKAAQLYRMAEEKGNGLTNNSWIWETQYNDEADCY